MTAILDVPVDPWVGRKAPRKLDLLIDGEWVKAQSEQTFQTHNPATVRQNVGDSYRGCLIVKVPKSSKLYWRIEGIIAGVARDQDD